MYVSVIVVDNIGEIRTIGINRPDKRNCIDLKTSKLLKQEIENFENDESSLVALLHGIGGNFCAGLDLNELSQIEGNLEEITRGKGTVVRKLVIFNTYDLVFYDMLH